MSKNIPELRFQEFHEIWKLKKLGDILDFKNGINADKDSYGKGIKFINVLDILNNNYITYDNILGLVDIDEATRKKYDVSYGDLLFQRSSEVREEVGTANVYLDKDKSCTFGGFVIRGKKIGSYNPFFMKNLLSTPYVRKEITSWSGGSTRYNVGQEILSKIQYISPEEGEQNKIAYFLSSVDKKIDLLTKKKELMEQYKKGIMQKIFSQEIRFKDDNGNDYPDWKILKAKQIFSNYTNKNHNRDLPILAVTQDKGVVDRNELDLKVNSSEEGIKNYKIIEPGCFIISLRSFQGGIELSKIKGLCSPAYTVLKNILDIDTEFFKYYLKKEDFISRLNKAVIGIRDGKQISYSVFGDLKLKYPILEEQIKIGKILISINNKICLIDKELLSVQEFKKGLLQKMFI